MPPAVLACRRLTLSDASVCATALAEGRDAHHTRLLLALDLSLTAACRSRGIPGAHWTDDDQYCMAQSIQCTPACAGTRPPEKSADPAPLAKQRGSAATRDPHRLVHLQLNRGESRRALTDRLSISPAAPHPLSPLP
jgi:hypothetical protein